MKKILIFGAGRGSRDTLQLIRQINDKLRSWDVLGFIDPEEQLKGKIIDGCPVLGSEFKSSSGEKIYGITGVQIPRIRKKIIEFEIESKGFEPGILVHPSVTIPDDLNIKYGCIIYPGVIIASNVSVGKGVIVNYHTLLGIDLTVGDYSFIGPSVTITASCSVGRECIIGAGSVFMPGVSVGNSSIVGLGTKLFSSVGDAKSVTDLPRKILKDKALGNSRVSL